MSQESTPEQKPSMMSPPRPETAPVVAPLTIEDKIAMDSLKQKNASTDDTSLIVNLDDTQSDLMDADLDVTNNSDNNESKDVTQNKSIRKSINESNNSSDSKSESNENKASSNEDMNKSSKDSNKITESSKSKSSNVQKDNKLKNKDSKNPSAAQKAQTTNGRNIWVSGLPPITKASELQNLFTKHGKVLSAKIIKNARMTGSRCYASEQSIQSRPQESTSKSVVARNKVNASKRVVTKTPNKSNASKESDNKETKSDEKSDDKSKSKASDEKTANKTSSEAGSSKTGESKEEKRKPIRAPIRDREPFTRPTFRRPQPFIKPFYQNSSSFRGFHRPGYTRGGGSGFRGSSSFTRGSSFMRGGYSRGMGYSRGGGFIRGGIRPMISAYSRPDVDRQIRERERERRIRDERRAREELMRAEKDMEREERIRFEREKERLKMDRMRLEREKAEFFRAEKERAKLEREKIEREREELRRRQNATIITNRVDDQRSRPSVVSTLTKRPFEARDDSSYWEERKRLQHMQRMDQQLIPGRQTYTESSPSVANRHSIPHSYNNRNESYKRNTRFEPQITGNTRTVFDIRRHDSRHGVSHDRDERKSGTAPSYYNRDTTRNPSFTPRDRKIGGPQREDWKTNQYNSRRNSDRYSDKPMSGGSASGFGTSRYGTDSRNWSDRSSMNKVSYGSGVHMSGGGQPYNQSSGNRWNSALSSSNESRSRGQTSLNSGMMSSNSGISDLYSQNPMGALSMAPISHSIGNSNMGSGDRYIHNNRRF
ncbi:unnamed protein product [Medioppia subpectinata]|uniref:RRM domain-containing protein n=1 Tax=Medioppia subpectinata TaxID=1979941 RepID=A0A7R9PVI1_9ACAR|nr:unnamed protein product [Medioppia subpectinata]CAG2102716.1 unnamed protein product [Medioppia subpectinata]